ncbi:hypothetical protein M405DRAFT_634361 [Rhizopogon salebrosus TDB-379]|nr:hypothetical protein M405DRAFT_634361 [Rhizopogon salebrosus TDB-379]
MNKKEATAEEQEIRNREHSDAGKKLKDVEYCAEAKCTNLVQVVDAGATGFTRVWKQATAKEDIPQKRLEDFADIIHDLIHVFGLDDADNTLFNIFWHPDDEDLMGFNRNRLIFLNLAHYAKKDVPLDMAYIEWYYIIAHEMAHSKTPFHDEHHELLFAALSSHYLPKLHKVPEVFNALECGMGCS